MRLLGYCVVFSLLITYKFLLCGFPQKKNSGNLYNFVLPRNSNVCHFFLLVTHTLHPSNSSPGHGSTAYFPPNVFLRLPRPTAHTETGERSDGARKHPQPVHRHTSLGEVPRLRRRSQVDVCQTGGRLRAKARVTEHRGQQRPSQRPDWMALFLQARRASYSPSMLGLVKLQTLIIWPV